MGCSFSLCLGQKKTGSSFISCPGRKRGCSFTSCLERRSDAVLCHAQDEGRMQFYVMPRTRINLKLRRSPVMNQEYYGFTSAHYT